MFEFITNEDVTNYSIKRPYYIENLEDLIKLNIDKITDYYHTSSKMVPNAEPLVRLVNMLSTEGTIYDVNDYVTEYGEYFAKRIGIGSSLARPRLTTVGGNDALIITNVSNMNILDFRNYKTLTPLRPYGGDTLDISCNLITDMETGLIVYTIDLVMLMNQYYWYMKDNPASNARAFVLTYVYTNMIKDFLELAIINGYTQNEELVCEPKHPFTILNIERQMVKVIASQKKYLLKSKRPYKEVLRNIHLPFSVSADIFFTRIIPVVNRQNSLAIYVALGSFTLDLIYLMGELGLKRNLGIVSRLRIGHDRMRSSNILQTLDLGLYKDTLEINFDILYNIVKNKEII